MLAVVAIAELLRREARRVPHREALIFEDRTATYAELDAEVDRYAAALSSLGVNVSTGAFREHMEVELGNDGPVTIWLEA